MGGQSNLPACVLLRIALVGGSASARCAHAAAALVAGLANAVATGAVYTSSTHARPCGVTEVLARGLAKYGAVVSEAVRRASESRP